MIRKAVIPCAGLGTRMLPFSAAAPKELLPVGTHPVFHYVLCEAAYSGVETVVLVNSSTKTALDNYLQIDDGLAEHLDRAGKPELLASLRALRDKIEIVSVRQPASLGLGHAISCAKPVVGQEAFAVLLPDELIIQDPPVLADLVAHCDQDQGAIALMEVPKSEVCRYGIATLHGESGSLVKSMVEKPNPEQANSRLAIVGRYVFPRRFQQALTALNPGVGGELQLTDAMRDNLQEFPLRGVKVSGQRHDTGNPEAYAKTVEHYLDKPDLFDDWVKMGT